jgi:hypothetical protein
VIMLDTQISECAAPYCHQKWHRMGEGKLFTFHVRNSSSDWRSAKHVWVCENCFESWEATLHEDSQIVLIPVYRRVG